MDSRIRRKELMLCVQEVRDVVDDDVYIMTITLINYSHLLH